MNGRHGLRTGAAAALIAAAGVLSMAGWGMGQRIEPAPVAGPVGLSVGNEARMALVRAERWIAAQTPTEDGGEPASGIGSVDDEEVARLLPLLDGDSGCLRPGENAFEAWGRLAAGLARQGIPMVYRDGTWVGWRNAILHALVVSQRPDGMGGGWWGEGEDDAWRSTRAASAALRLLLGRGESAE